MGSIIGRIWVRDRQDFEQIKKIIVIGRSIQVYEDSPSGKLPAADAKLYDRQVLAFGTQGQVILSKAKVAVIGVGGTGSSTAEQLVRLGVKDLVLVDHDNFALSNLTRMYGTFSPTNSVLKQFSRRKSDSKVDIIASHLKHIQPTVEIRRIPQKIVLSKAAQFLLDRDIIFLCTDDHWGRSIVNQIAYQYLIPVINIGMGIRSQNGTITAASGAVDIIRSGTACLWCSQFLNPDRITAESISQHKRQQLREEGYVEDVGTPTPSVVSVTTTLAGIAVTKFLQMMTDFMGKSGDISRLRYDIMDGTVRRGRTNIVAGCVCQKNKGYGDLRPLHTVESLPAGI